MPQVATSLSNKVIAEVDNRVREYRGLGYTSSRSSVIKAAVELNFRSIPIYLYGKPIGMIVDETIAAMMMKHLPDKFSVEVQKEKG